MANVLTVLRILLTLPLVVSIVQEKFGAALFITLVGGLSDMLDGRMARQNGESSNLGKFLDPLADKIFIMSALIALIEVGRVSSLPVILLFLRELSVSFMRSMAIGHGIYIEASAMGKLKTFLEFISLILLIAGNPYSIYLLWLSICVAYISAYDYLKTYLKSLSGLNYP